MCCRINRQHGLQEQATTAIIADRSQTACLGMMGVIKVRGILHQQDHRQGLHLAARLLIMRLHQLLKGDIGLIKQTIHCLDLFSLLHLGGQRGRGVFCHGGSRCHCPSRPTHIFQQNTTKGQFCPAPRVQQILCVHFLILPDYLCNMWVQVRAEARGVLSGASTLPPSLSWRGKAALVWLHSDFWADALRHEGCPCFGAAPAPHSRVLALARVLPAGAPPHLPNTAGTGHTRGWDLLDRDGQPETPSRGHAAPARCRTGTGANAGRAAW
jgi:hypothetical protein